MSLLRRFFSPLIDALFCPGLSFSYRWRLLALQPIAFLTQCIQWIPNIRSDRYTIHNIPLKRHPGHFVRTAIFQPNISRDSRPRPLHINVHGGAFVGGLPEGDARFCKRVVEATGAVVVSTSYRFAPRHTFPVAHEDVQDIAAYLVENGSQIWNLDPHLITVSGFSAGGNLALGLSQALAETEYAVKASVTFYAVIDLRLPPWEKPKPAGFPTWDPLSFLQPLFDAYAGPKRAQEMKNPLLSPIVADIESLPPDMLFIIPTVDILLAEQTAFVKRLQEDAEKLNRLGRNQGEDDRMSSPQKGSSLESQQTEQQIHEERRYTVQSKLFEGQIHGWLELPSAAIDEQTRREAFDSAVQFLKNVHRKYGWNYEQPSLE
ncbi:Alpha/Beta hydrolase protein [Aspergillus floccosus]